MFIRIYNNSFTVKWLRELFKRKRLSNYSKLNKQELVNFFKKYYAGLYIVNFVFKKIRKTTYINFEDPITMERIVYPYIYTEIQPDKLVRYNIPDIYNYIKSTGTFRDPYTGIIFSDKNLKSIDDQLSFYNMKFVSLYKLKYHPKYIQYYKDAKEKELQLVGLDRQIGEIITESQDCADSICFSQERESLLSYYELINNLLPSFSILFRQLALIDYRYAKTSGENYLSTFKNSIASPSLLKILTDYIKTEISII